MATAATAANATTLDPPLLTRCAWCTRYQAGDEWLDEQTVRAFTRPGDWGTMTHGICPGCVVELRRRGLSH